MGNKKSSIKRIQAFMDSAKGKTIMNYMYSWGAAIVILGTLFKLTHITGANIMLFIGMGTEVIVFFLFAFERPYEVAAEEEKEERALDNVTNNNIAGGSLGANDILPENAGLQVAGIQVANEVTVSNMVGLAPQMDEATQEYIEKIHALNETLGSISKQSEALGRNMEELETLGRNLTSINSFYEIQLRSAGSQLTNIDSVNEQTKKMAKQIEELNMVYARMLEAMTANMNKPQ